MELPPLRRFTYETVWYIPEQVVDVIQQEPEPVDFYRQVTLARAPQKRVTARSETVARGLLESMLNPVQLATLRNGRFIDVLGSAGGKYRVFTNCSVSHNVYNVTDPGRMRTICYHLIGAHPASDHILGQLAIICTDEPSLDRYPQVFLDGMNWIGHADSTFLPPYTAWNPGIARTA